MSRHFLVPLHEEGWRFVAIFAAVSVLLGLLVWSSFYWIGAAATLWCAYFFRDPPRMTPQRVGLIVSPADGLVHSVGPAVPPLELDLPAAPMTRVSIFLSIFDVHIQRVPADASIDVVAYHPGQFISATNDKSSELNERSSVSMTMQDGQRLVLVQIAGAIARRIRNDLKPQQAVLAGTRYGLIRFGSRVDLYLPEGVTPLVCAGQRAIGGETIIADLHADEAPRQGQER